jgi:hypothetical protein
MGDMEIWGHGDTGTWGHGDMKTWRHGDMGTWGWKRGKWGLGHMKLKLGYSDILRKKIKLETENGRSDDFS